MCPVKFQDSSGASFKPFHMNTLVKHQKVVAHPETGEVITLFTKTDSMGNEKTYGRVRIDSVEISVVDGFVSPKRRTAFVTLTQEAVELLKDHIQEGKPYPIDGKIMVVESTFPQYEGHEPKINPSTGEEVHVNGYHVYRKTEFTTDLSVKDQLITSLNVASHQSNQMLDQPMVVSEEEVI